MHRTLLCMGVFMPDTRLGIWMHIYAWAHSHKHESVRTHLDQSKFQSTNRELFTESKIARCMNRRTSSDGDSNYSSELGQNIRCARQFQMSPSAHYTNPCSTRLLYDKIMRGTMTHFYGQEFLCRLL